MYILDNSHNYVLEFQDLASRLDFAHYHPDFSYLDRLQDFTTFDVLKLKDVCQENIISGTTPKNLKYDKYGVDFLGASNIFDTGVTETNKRVDKAYIQNEMKNLTVRNGDILIYIAGVGVGRTGVYEKEKVSLISQSVARVRVNENIVLSKYLSLFFNSKIGQDIFLKYRHDVGQPNINTDELKELPIIIPKDLEKQQKIVDSLYSKLIKLKKMNNEIDSIYDIIPEKLSFRKKSKDMNLFFKTDKEQTSNYTKFVDSVNDRLDFIYSSPKLSILDEMLGSNKFIELEKVITQPLIRGEQPIYSEFGDGIVVKTSTLNNINLNCDNASKVSFDFTQKKTCILKKNDILLSSTGIKSLGKIDKFNCRKNAIADGHITIIRIDSNKYDIDYIMYYLRSMLGQLQIEKYWSGSSGQIELNINEIKKILVPSPEAISKDEQIKIAKKITNKINTHLKKKKKEKETRIEVYNDFREMILS